MKKILVIGSLNLDITFTLDRLPKLGETRLSHAVYETYGGKGANQAVAIGKLGAPVDFLGAVGDDAAGQKMIENLKANQVNTEAIIVKPNVYSGRANIYVDTDGNNMIVVDPGANFELTPEDIEKNKDRIKDVDFCLLQLEIPMETVEAVIKICKEYGVQVVLNPAPANENGMDKLLQYVDHLVLNETEFESLTRSPFSMDTVDEMAKQLFAYGIKTIVLTLGDKGSILLDNKEKIYIEAIPVQAVDTTAAGDSYLGGMLYGLSKDYDIKTALEIGTQVASITVTRAGAQDSIPSLSEITLPR